MNFVIDGQSKTFDGTVEKVRPISYSMTIVLDGCSGFVAKLPDASIDDFALAFTNGHCLTSGFLPPQKFKINVPSSHLVKILDKDGRALFTELRARRIIYASMTDVDLAVYELPLTYKNLEEKSGEVVPELLRQPLDVNSEVFLISGFNASIQKCSLSGEVTLLKEDRWSFKNSIRIKNCDIKDGTSGSPLIDASTGQIVGLINTYNQTGEACSLNNPCEAAEDGRKFAFRGTAYGLKLDLLLSCAINGKIDFLSTGCLLPH